MFRLRYLLASLLIFVLAESYLLLYWWPLAVGGLLAFAGVLLYYVAYGQPRGTRADLEMEDVDDAASDLP